MENMNKLNTAADDEIDLRELFAVIWQGKWIILAITALFAMVSVLYALSLPNIYKSEALLAPASEQYGAGISGQLGGLAALAGVNLGSGARVDKTALALEIVKSRDFLGRFISRRVQLQDLMAVKNWDLVSNKLHYDKEVFNEKSNVWLRKVNPPKQSIPSFLEAYKVFSERFKVSQDPSSRMVKFSFEHESPYIARDWLKLLISDLNQEMKSRDIEEAQKSIEYLKSQIDQTKIADLQSSLYSLIEEQTKTLMLANVRDEYALKIIDDAIVPEEKTSPKRALIVLLITFVGGGIATLFVLFLNLCKKGSEATRND